MRDPDFLAEPDYGIPPSWGYVDYLHSHDVTGMYVVMAAVDEFVTLLDGQHPSKWLSYTLYRPSQRRTTGEPA